MFYDFKTITHGKWILAGEHTVLRNGPALVFPVPDKTFVLTYCSNDSMLSIKCVNESANALYEVLWCAIREGLRLLHKPDLRLHGNLMLEHNIPVGSGMGASAALCVAVARWFEYQGWLPAKELLIFARTLENMFHGKSSGVDIIGASSLSGVYFQNGQQSPVQQVWQPQWYLSFCGERGLTSLCIQKVQWLWEHYPEKAQRIDTQMCDSVRLALDALQSADTMSAIDTLAQSLMLSADCFAQWDLITPALADHMQQLRIFGAMATKPTGSGGGGFVLSLWSAPPPAEIPILLWKA